MPNQQCNLLAHNELFNQDEAVVEYAETVKAIQEGIDSIERGEGRPADEVFDELQCKYDIPD